MPDIPCYLRTRRREWCLTQSELAFLVSECGRQQISAVERGLTAPKGSELMAYAFIFDCAPEDLFPAYADESRTPRSRQPTGYR
jgi:transcriptional regulator with XRE-family HTH domain